jgi:hypothetical protein
MTLKYKLFGFPGSEKEFLDEQIKLGNKKVQIYIQTYIGDYSMGCIGSAVHKLFIISNDGKNNFEVKIDKSYFPPEASATDIPMRDDRSPLIKRLKSEGFEITSRKIGSLSPKKALLYSVLLNESLNN